MKAKPNNPSFQYGIGASVFGDRLAEGKSSRGLEQSKTLRACRKPSECAERLGVRWPSTAFRRGLPVCDNLTMNYFMIAEASPVVALLPFLFFIPCMLIGVALMAFWIWMLVDCATKEPSQGNDKVVWILVIALTHWIGALIYFLVRRPQRKKEFGA